MAEGKDNDETPTPADLRRKKKACADHREDLLDEALEESFPASDPPSIAQPPAKDC